MINQVSLDFSYRGLPGLWSGSHTSRLPQLIGVILVVRVVRGHRCSRDCLLDPRVLQADAGRLKGSHPMIFTNISVSVIAPLSLASSLTLFLALIS